ncbi:MAG: hypothetical protein ACXAEN_20245 [Candidatus Thorarchaeota archaeon]
MIRILKKKKDIGKLFTFPDDTNFLSAEDCRNWVSETAGWKDIDVGWTMGDFNKNDPGSAMTCIGWWLKPKPQYAEVCHYTLGDCCKEILGLDEVYCIRRRKGSRWASLTKHVAGACKAVHYVKKIGEGGD